MRRVTIAHRDQCPVNAPGFVAWTSNKPRPANYATCNCDFGIRLSAHLNRELTKTQRERVDQIAAWCMGDADSSPESCMTDEEKKDSQFVAAVYEQVFYCEDCGYYWSTDERHVGDLCDDCHDLREDGLED